MPFSYLERFLYDANDNLVPTRSKIAATPAWWIRPSHRPLGDVNGDQYVDDIDLATLLANHGMTWARRWQTATSTVTAMSMTTT